MERMESGTETMKSWKTIFLFCAFFMFINTKSALPSLLTVFSRSCKLTVGNADSLALIFCFSLQNVCQEIQRGEIQPFPVPHLESKMEKTAKEQSGNERLTF